MKLFIIRLLSLLPFQQKDTWAIVPNPEWPGHTLAIRNPIGMSNSEEIKAATLRSYRIAQRYGDEFYYNCRGSW